MTTGQFCDGNIELKACGGEGTLNRPWRPEVLGQNEIVGRLIILVAKRSVDACIVRRDVVSPSSVSVTERECGE